MTADDIHFPILMAWDTGFYCVSDMVQLTTCTRAGERWLRRMLDRACLIDASGQIFRIESFRRDPQSVGIWGKVKSLLGRPTQIEITGLSELCVVSLAELKAKLNGVIEAGLAATGSADEEIWSETNIEALRAGMAAAKTYEEVIRLF